MAKCHDGSLIPDRKALRDTILLIGPPNVGKSVTFNRLTGMDVSVANYAGTTVDFMQGTAQIRGQKIPLIDVPGTYTLDATNEAEQVAVDMLDARPRAIVFVMDANEIETGLHLLLQVLEREIPTVVALNRCDLALEKGHVINVPLLAKELGVPIIRTIAIEGEGFSELTAAVAGTMEAQTVVSPRRQESTRWEEAERLVALTRKTTGASFSWRQSLGRSLVRPWPGIPLAVLILGAVFGLVIGLGMGLRRMVLLPVVRGLIIPRIVWVVEGLVPAGMVQEVLIGEFGFLVKGLEWPFTLVLPYVISFYTALAILEDSGYLPRFGVLLDGLLNRIGMHGSSIVPLLLGYGCGIPGILATRVSASAKERMIVSFLICLAVPCIAQTGAFISLLAEASLAALVGVFALSTASMILAGLFLDNYLKGPRPVTLLEIPELLLPKRNVVLKKVWVRLHRYVYDGAIPMIIAVGIAAVLYETGSVVFIGQLIEPLVTGWLQLPQEAAVPLMLGVFRRELAVLPLLDMDLTSLQLFVGAAVGLFYVPCIAMIAVIAREFRLTTAMGILVATTAIAFLVGGLLSRLGHLLL